MSVLSRHKGAVPLKSRAEDMRINTFLLLMMILIGIGLVMMTSASMEIGNSMASDPLYFFKRQVFFIGVSLVLMVAVLHVDMQFWYRLSPLLLAIAMVLLVLVLIPGVGTVVNGSARWLDLGFYRLQPSEMSKVFMVLFLASFLSRRRAEVQQNWSGFMKPMLIMGTAVILLHFEPDHGAMVILMATTFSLLFLAGARIHRFMLFVMICFAGFAWLAISKPYVINRLTSFLNPWAAEYVYGEGYQLTQALIAFGRGEWFGVGLGNSIQKLYFLPEAHTDFVLSIVAEELGMLGVLTVLCLFTALIAKAFMVGRLAELQGNYFNAYVVYGVAVIFAAQAFINFGVNTGLLPTKGLTLPFLSYGGNSLLISCFMVALLMRVEYELENKPSVTAAGGES
jgi:cell division protein FtsW